MAAGDRGGPADGKGAVAGQAALAGKLHGAFIDLHRAQTGEGGRHDVVAAGDQQGAGTGLDEVGRGDSTGEQRGSCLAATHIDESVLGDRQRHRRRCRRGIGKRDGRSIHNARDGGAGNDARARHSHADRHISGAGDGRNGGAYGRGAGDNLTRKHPGANGRRSRGAVKDDAATVHAQQVGGQCRRDIGASAQRVDVAGAGANLRGDAEIGHQGGLRAGQSRRGRGGGKGEAVGGVVFDEVDVAGGRIIDNDSREKELIVNIAGGAEAAGDHIFSGGGSQIGQSGRPQGQGAQVHPSQRGRRESGAGGTLVELNVGTAAISHGGDRQRLGDRATHKAESASIDCHRGGAKRSAAGGGGAHCATAGPGQQRGRAGGGSGDEGQRSTADGERCDGIRESAGGCRIERKHTVASLRQTKGSGDGLIDCQRVAGGNINATGNSQNEVAAGGESARRLQHATAKLKVRGATSGVDAATRAIDHSHRGETKISVRTNRENTVVDEGGGTVVGIRGEQVFLSIGSRQHQHPATLLQQVGSLGTRIAQAAGEGNRALEILDNERAVLQHCISADVEILCERQGIVTAEGFDVGLGTGPDAKCVHDCAVTPKGFNHTARTGIAPTKG